LLQNCLDLFSIKVKNNNIELELLYDNNAPIFIVSDEIRIK